MSISLTQRHMTHSYQIIPTTLTSLVSCGCRTTAINQLDNTAVCVAWLVLPQLILGTILQSAVMWTSPGVSSEIFKVGIINTIFLNADPLMYCM
jgi:hypothetical protein